jgi:hypothetical protein
MDGAERDVGRAGRSARIEVHVEYDEPSAAVTARQVQAVLYLVERAAGAGAQAAARPMTRRRSRLRAGVPDDGQ